MREGYFDQVLNGWICGWAWESDLPEGTISVDLFVDDCYHGAIPADRFRPDLERAGKGNGQHAFEIKVPARYYDGRSHELKLCFAGTSLDLHHSPQSIYLAQKSGLAYRVNDSLQRAALDERIRCSMLGNGAPTPKVSVIVPCFNLGEYLDEAIDSVLEQTAQSFEILVVNDGSTDPFTNQLLDNYSRPLTRVIRTENRGPGAARNAGIQLARGSYICALDADDKLHPSYFEKAIKVLDADPSIAFVSSWLETFGDEEWVWKQDRCDLATLLGECTVATPALVRKTAVAAVGGYDEDTAQWGNEDWLLWISLVEQGCKGTILPEVLFYYRKRLGSLSAFWMQGEAHLRKLRAVVSKHGGSYRKYLIDVLLRKEGEICDLLRENDATERSIHWLEQQILSWKKEIKRLQEKFNKEQRVRDLAPKVAELERQVAEKSQQIQAFQIEHNQLKQQEVGLEHALKNCELQILAMRQSRSWKVTAPLRAINARLPLFARGKFRTAK